MRVKNLKCRTHHISKAGLDRTRRTDILTPAAADTLRTVDLLCDLHRHGAGLFTALAVHALIPLQGHLIKAEPLKESVKRT